MTTLITAPNPGYIAPGEIALVSVSFTGILDPGETISTVSVPDNTITATGEAVTTVAKDIEEETEANGNQVPIGKAVTFLADATAGVDGTDYVLTITVTTTNSQTRKRKVTLKCRAS